MPFVDADRDSYFSTGTDLFIRNEPGDFREWATQIRWDQSSPLILFASFSPCAFDPENIVSF